MLCMWVKCRRSFLMENKCSHKQAVFMAAGSPATSKALSRVILNTQNLSNWLRCRDYNRHDLSSALTMHSPTLQPAVHIPALCTADSPPLLDAHLA